MLKDPIEYPPEVDPKLHPVFISRALSDEEKQKIPVADHIYYEGHVGFYREDEIEEAFKVGKHNLELRNSGGNGKMRYVGDS